MHRSFALRWFAAPLLFCALACSGPTEPKPALTTLAITGTATLMVNETTILTASGKDQNGLTFPTGTISWTSSDASKATVGADGTVTAKGVGAVTITATSGTVQGTFALTVAGTLVQENRTITASESWTAANGPYLVRGDLTIDGAGTPTLTIGAGTTVKFAAGARMYVAFNTGGALITQGTAAAPVTFTTANATAAAGQWRGVWFSTKAAGASTLAHTVVEYCGQGMSCLTLDEGVTVPMNTITVRHSSTGGVKLTGTAAFGTGSTTLSVQNTAEFPIIIHANRVGTLPTGGSFSNNTVNKIQVTGGDVLTTQSWPNLGVPYAIAGDVYVDGVGTPVLTLPAGTRLLMGTGVRFYVGWDQSGALVTEGTASSKVTFTADAATPTAGHWKGLIFTAVAASSSSLTHTDLSYCGATNDACLRVESGQTGFKVTNVSVSNTLGAGINLGDTGRFTSGSANLSVSNAATAPLIVHPNFAGSIPSTSTFTANGVNMVRVTGGDIVTSQVWPKLSIPYAILNDIYIDAPSTPTLTLQAGAHLRFAIDAILYVGWDHGGQLVAGGTAADSVRLTADAAMPAAGHWRGIAFTDVAGNGSDLSYAIVEHAGRNGWAALTFFRDIGATVKNSRIRFSADCGIERREFGGWWLTDFTASALGNAFSENTGGNQCGP